MNIFRLWCFMRRHVSPPLETTVTRSTLHFISSRSRTQRYWNTHTFVLVTLALERCVDVCVTENVHVSALYFEVVERLPKRTECLLFKMSSPAFLKRKMTLSKAEQSPTGKSKKYFQHWPTMNYRVFECDGTVPCFLCLELVCMGIVYFQIAHQRQM